MMKRWCNLLVLAILIIITTANVQDMEEEINIPIQYYFEGTANGDIEKLKKGFHPECKIYFVDSTEKMAFYTQSEFHDLVKKNHGKAKRINKLIYVDRSNNTALAKTRSDFPTFYFIDYLILLQIEGSWKIVSKSTTTYKK
ncbi:MAG: nuclear transport factor 2 family protein [Saonia sp.]